MGGEGAVRPWEGLALVLGLGVEPWGLRFRYPRFGRFGVFWVWGYHLGALEGLGRPFWWRRVAGYFLVQPSIRLQTTIRKLRD